MPPTSPVTFPVVDLNTAQPEVRWLRAPLSDAKTREVEAVGWVSSNYVTGFTYRWDQFRAPVAALLRGARIVAHTVQAHAQV